jgi:hypothetical protein
MEIADAEPWIVGLLVTLGVVAYGAWLTQSSRVPGDVVEVIEQHLAPEGTVMFVRPALVPFGGLAPGARQYLVDITTPLGFSRTHTVAIDQAGNVRTIL